MRVTSLTSIEQLLLDALRGWHGDIPPDADGVSAAEWSDVASLALRQRVGALLWHQLTFSGVATGLPQDTQRLLRDHSRRAAYRGLLATSAFTRLAAAVRHCPITIVALKGLHLGTSVYPSRALREMGDIDILVAPEHALAVAHAAEQLGYRTSSPLPTPAAVTANHHLPRMQTSTMALEIHWHIVAPELGVVIPIEELRQRAVPSALAPNTSTLSSEDLLLHLCVHAALQHDLSMGLRAVCDPWALLERTGEQMDWDAVIRRAREWKITRAVVLVLRLTEVLLGSRVPTAVMQSLGSQALPDAIVEAAARRLFDAVEHPSTVTPAAAALLAENTWQARSSQVVHRMWKSREVLQSTTPDAVTATGLRLLWLRIRRVASAVARHSGPVGRRALATLGRGNAPSRIRLEHRLAVARWLKRPARGDGAVNADRTP